MTKQIPIAILRCTPAIAGTIFIILGALLFFVGCASVYKFIGLDEDQVLNQTAKDSAAAIHIIDTGRQQLWQIATAATTGLGTILSGLLATWLRTEKKITKTLITSIEAEADNDLKTKVKAKASAAGIEPKLNARVRALT